MFYTANSQTKKLLKIAKTKFSMFYKNEVTSMIKVGNTCIAISSIDPSFICLYFNLLFWLDIVVAITTTIAAS